MSKEQCKLNELDDEWELILTRTLNHPCEEVWTALTRAEELVKWGPFKPNKDLTDVGPVDLTHMNNPKEDARQGYVLAVEPPHLLVFRWGVDILRWELHEIENENATHLILRHQFADRKTAPSYAAGWHLCLHGLKGILAGIPMPSMVGSDAVKYGYKDLYRKYETKFDFNVEGKK